ncbi:MAG TPA: hypothetical protein VF150_09365, partial [Thermoanaerobaculia bacterium]
MPGRSTPPGPTERPPVTGGAWRLTAALLLFAAVAGAFRVRAYDLFWHLAAGRWIAEHDRLPRS